jgi:hypothetical protein
MKHLLVGCSFTDPVWQPWVTPWSVDYSNEYSSYIVAKPGMGIHGICTEALYYLQDLAQISKVVVLLPNLWRMDLEMDVETYLCTAMLDCLQADNGTYGIFIKSQRKWITSGGLHYNRTTEQAKIFDLLYKHQGFLVLAKQHFRSLKLLIDHCNDNNIDIHISAIQDPLQQLTGLDYIRDDVEKLLATVDYKYWFKFDGEFVDKFLNHTDHPTTQEHKVLCEHIIKNTQIRR